MARTFSVTVEEGVYEKLLLLKERSNRAIGCITREAIIDYLESGAVRPRVEALSKIKSAKERKKK